MGSVLVRRELDMGSEQEPSRHRLPSMVVHFYEKAKTRFKQFIINLVLSSSFY